MALETAGQVGLLKDLGFGKLESTSYRERVDVVEADG